MNITAELSMYPLGGNHVPAIVSFIKQLRSVPGVEVVSNQMSTQVRGEYDAVTTAINSCMRQAMQNSPTMVMVVKYLSVDLDIAAAPAID